MDRSQQLSLELEQALLRELASLWRDYNAAYFKGRLTPASIFLGESEARLGQWHLSRRTIELSRAFVLRAKWGQVVEVLKHEMAHQYVSEVLGDPDESPHGLAFRELCAAHGIDARAAGLPHGAEQQGDAETRVLSRVSKLLALAESTNVNEAELAMAEAQRLLLKHNLERVAASSYHFTHVGTPTGRIAEHEQILAGLLGSHFFVEVIWVPVWRVHEGKRGSVLELLGTRTNLEIAAYTHAFLLGTADRLWRDYKRARRISNRDRRTFLAGVMMGFRDRLDTQRKQSEKEGLVWVGDADLARYLRKRQPYIRHVRRGGNARSESHRDGRAAGREIVLHKGVAQTGSRGLALWGR